MLFFEKRILFLEGAADYSYTDDSMPYHYTTSPRGVIDQIIYLKSLSSNPIKLIIDSPGGLVRAALGLYDIMMTAHLPIYTIARSVAFSASTIILSAGAPGCRYILPNAKTMIHLPYGGYEGHYKDAKIAMQEFEKDKDKLISILSRHTGKSAIEIEPLMEHDHWMNAKESQDFGLVDHVVEDWSELLKV